MKRFFTVKVMLSLATVLLLMAAFAIPLSGSLRRSHAAQIPSTTAATSKLISSQTFAATYAYWTPTRMQSARSADLLVTSAKLTKPPAQTGPSGMGKPAIPRGQSGNLSPDASKIPHSSYGTYPYSTIGKVFFTDPNTGLNYVCSGA